MIQEFSEFEDCEKEKILKWFKYGVGGHQLLTDEEIHATVMEDESPSVDHDEEEDFSGEDRCLETALMWVE